MPASAGDIGSDLGLNAGFAAGLAVAAYGALSLFVEAPLLAWADRGRVRWVSSLALLAMGGLTLSAACATSAWWLLLALALIGPASGCAVAASEGVLVESQPDQRERTMTRLMIAGVIGDLLVPVVLVTLATVGLGWRSGLALGAVATLLLAASHACSRSLDRPMSQETDDEPSPALGELVQQIRRHPALVGWSSLSIASNALDETLVAFSLVHLDRLSGSDAVLRGGALAALTVTELLALLILDRILARVSSNLVLVCAATGGALALTVFALTPSPLVAIAALAALGAFSATFHPLAKARAYASLPGRPGLVNAVGALFGPFDVLTPLSLATIALSFGSRAALLVFVAAPLAFGLAALPGLLRRPS